MWTGEGGGGGGVMRLSSNGISVNHIHIQSVGAVGELTVTCTGGWALPWHGCHKLPI